MFIESEESARCRESFLVLSVLRAKTPSCPNLELMPVWSHFIVRLKPPIRLPSLHESGLAYYCWWKRSSKDGAGVRFNLRSELGLAGPRLTGGTSSFFEPWSVMGFTPLLTRGSGFSASVIDAFLPMSYILRLAIERLRLFCTGGGGVRYPPLLSEEFEFACISRNRSVFCRSMPSCLSCSAAVKKPYFSECTI